MSAVASRSKVPNQSDRIDRVLVVNDAPDQLELTAAVLRHAGYAVLFANTGAEGVEIASRENPDVVISDVVMPEMDGLELCRRIRAVPKLKLTPLLLVSGLATDSKSAVAGLKAGADDYLEIPFDPMRLVSKVARLIERKRAEELLQQQREMLERANESLEQSERRYRDLVENLNDVVFSVDAQGLVVYISPAVQKYGYDAEQLVGQPVSVLVHPEDLDGVRRCLSRAVDDLATPHEFRAVDRFGAIHRVRASTRAFFDRGRYTGATGVVMDVTDQRRAEEQLRASQRLEAVGRLAGGIAHDFNNLLVAINGYAEFALEAVREGDPMRADLEEILKAGNRAAALTRQLLAFSRKQVLKPEVINLNDVVSGMEPMLRRLIGEDIEFQTTLGEGLGRVLADPGQMEQVIMNLVVNARDAMPTGGRLVVETTNQTAAEAEPTTREWVVLSVSDTGCGMDEQTKAQIFEPFFSTKAPGDGTGLGLATVHGIVNQSGGSITVETAPGKGARFHVVLPRASGDPRQACRSAEAERGQGRETILLVEDEPAVRQLATRFLSAAGYRVLVAANAGEALLTCENHEGPIDLLLTDVVMPQMSGHALSARLGRIRGGLRVLYMSGYSGSAIAHHGVLDQGMHLLQKPFSSADLLRRVREVLQQACPRP
jgi:two-component system, cell cycle sensor histidine kinase and response regulator CckA